MASCITSQWVSTSPQVQLTVTQTASTATTATLSWTLQYISQYAASSNPREYSAVINGTTVGSGTYAINGKTGTHTIDSGTVTITKGTSVQSIAFSVTMAFNLTWSGVYFGTKTASGSISVAAKTSYTIKYNANGGGGAPSSQTKWHGTAITLSSTKPTRTGYAFQGWATSASGSVAYAAGASYTANAAVTLYAVWKANTYTVKYNANGGSGAPSNQTKTYGVPLTLSGTKPTRTNYKFLGWGTSASATTVSYAAGASYTANAPITLYAVWELAYVEPRITNLTVTRCDANGVESDIGAYVCVKYKFACDQPFDSNEIAWKTEAGEQSEIADHPYTSDGNNGGSVNYIIDRYEFSAEFTYSFTITVYDTAGHSVAFATLNGTKFPIDLRAGGDGVAFGKPAEFGASNSLGGSGVVDFAFDAKFNEPVYGKALGMDRLPAIQSNSDFNDYKETGCYAVYSNAIAATCANIPVERAGRLEVWSATGEGVRLEQWSYLRQRYIPYNSSNAVWERELTRGENNAWVYYDWWKSSLTPVVSEKVYSKAAMTVAISANSTWSTSGVYTPIPFDQNVLSTSGRLTLQDNTIRIGENISHVKVNGQATLKCGSTTGNRHVRIQKVSGSAIHSLAWSCVYGTASSNVAYVLTPMIVSVKEGDLIRMVYYTTDTADYSASGSSVNGWQTYLTVEEL